MTNFNFNTDMSTDKDGFTNIKIDFKDSEGGNIQIDEKGNDLVELFNRVVEKFDNSYEDMLKDKQDKDTAPKDESHEKDQALIEEYKNKITSLEDRLYAKEVNNEYLRKTVARLKKENNDLKQRVAEKPTFNNRFDTPEFNFSENKYEESISDFLKKVFG